MAPKLKKEPILANSSFVPKKESWISSDAVIDDNMPVYNGNNILKTNFLYLQWSLQISGEFIHMSCLTG